MNHAYGVIGHPVGQSLSPVMHQTWLREAGLDGSYDAYDIAPGALSDLRSFLKSRGLKGVNVTVPHKETIMAHLDRIAPQAKRIGAVNTVRVEDDGSLVGFNTDGLGFLAPLKAVADCLTRPVLVIGAGGAARAIIAALMTTSCPLIMMSNRSMDRAEALATDIGGGRISLVEGSDRADAVLAAGLIVNTTTLGMVGCPPLDLDLTGAGQDTVVYDIVYKPLETPLIEAAKARGLRTIDGLHMLVHQGAEAFRIWTGQSPECMGARERLLTVLRNDE